MQTKKAVRVVILQVEEQQKSKSILREEILTGMWLKMEDPLARKDAGVVPQLFLESTAPFLGWCLAWEYWKDAVWMPVPKREHWCGPH